MLVGSEYILPCHDDVANNQTADWMVLRCTLPIQNDVRIDFLKRTFDHSSAKEHQSFQVKSEGDGDISRKFDYNSRPPPNSGIGRAKHQMTEEVNKKIIPKQAKINYLN